MPRVYERKFDWDEARQRHWAGETYTQIGRALGVSPQAVARVVDPAVNERMARAVAEWQRSGTCSRCGGPATRASGRCRQCMAIEWATTARDSELQCVTCRRWLPDNQFARHKRRIGRRGRHRQCRDCNTIAKRAWRARTGRD